MTRFSLDTAEKFPLHEFVLEESKEIACDKVLQARFDMILVDKPDLDKPFIADRGNFDIKGYGDDVLWGGTPLHFCLSTIPPNLRVAKLLLEKGASTHLAIKRDDNQPIRLIRKSELELLTPLDVWSAWDTYFMKEISEGEMEDENGDFAKMQVQVEAFKQENAKYFQYKKPEPTIKTEQEIKQEKKEARALAVDQKLDQIIALLKSLSQSNDKTNNNSDTKQTKPIFNGGCGTADWANRNKDTGKDQGNSYIPTGAIPLIPHLMLKNLGKQKVDGPEQDVGIDIRPASPRL